MLDWLTTEGAVADLADAEDLVLATIQAEVALGGTVNVWEQLQSQLKGVNSGDHPNASGTQA